MQVGDTGQEVNSVLLTTDVTPAVVDEAVRLGCQLIISHHPLLFHGLKQVCGQSAQAQAVEACIRHGIAVYSAHTSLDSVWGGINTRLADLLGITDYRILVPKPGAPRNANEAMFRGESGGTSCFNDRAAVSPCNLVAEREGLGIIGSLPAPMDFHSFLVHVRDTLGATYVRYTLPTPLREGSMVGFLPSLQGGGGGRLVTTVALCGGSGAEFIGEAIAQGADVYITADCKYHEFQDAGGKIALVDIDHWVSERHCREIFRDLLTPHGIDCRISQADQTPIQVLQ